MCSEYSSSKSDVVTKCNNLGLSLMWCNRLNVKYAVWDKFVDTVGW